MLIVSSLNVIVNLLAIQPLHSWVRRNSNGKLRYSWAVDLATKSV